MSRRHPDRPDGEIGRPSRPVRPSEPISPVSTLRIEAYFRRLERDSEPVRAISMSPRWLMAKDGAFGPEDRGSL